MRFVVTRVLFPIFMLVCLCHSLFAEQNKNITNVSFGSYIETHGGDHTSGTMLSIAVKHFVSDAWAYFVRLGNGHASGSHEFGDGTAAEIKSSRSFVSGGPIWHYPLESAKWLQPYVGFALSVQSYRYDYKYSGSEIGSTSGTGYGPLFLAGVRMDIASHFLIIPGYEFEQIHIESENGENQIVSSSGIILALVIRF